MGSDDVERVGVLWRVCGDVVVMMMYVIVDVSSKWS